MENPATTTEQTRSKIDLFDNIDMRLKKAKAIVFLMSYAANEGSMNCGEELIWAQQVANGLIDDAMKSVAVLADQKPENEA